MTCRLQLRSMLMPEVVNQMAALEGQKGKKAPPKKNWSVSADMFPCQLSPDTLSQAREVSPTSKHESCEKITSAKCSILVKMRKVISPISDII